MKALIFSILCLTVLQTQTFAQAGITVSPGKLYYKIAPGNTGTQKITVSNPNNRELQIGISLSDWDYDSLGNNNTYNAGTLKTSCSDWIKVLPGSYFTLQPNEKRDLDIVFTVPPGAETEVPVHTAMLFLTQLNPGDVLAKDGTSIRVSVRMGIKLYHSFTQEEKRGIEIVNFKDVAAVNSQTPDFLELQLNNTGKIWLESKIKWEILNTQTGEKEKLNDQSVYSLPGDSRLVRLQLPANLKKGKYSATAIINYGNKDELKIAELEFMH